MDLFLQFIYSTLATLGFCIIFNVPLKKMPAAAAIGGIGWVVYQICIAAGYAVAPACFLGAFAVGLGSDIASRTLKEAATVFIIPGVLPLVPGAGIYYTMLAAVNGDLAELASTGLHTLTMAGSIALGLLVVATLIKVFTTITGSISKKIKTAQ